MTPITHCLKCSTPVTPTPGSRGTKMLICPSPKCDWAKIVGTIDVPLDEEDE